MPTHIVLTTAIYPPDVGGPATYVERLARTLDATGWVVTVVATAETRSGVEIENGIRVVRVRRSQPLVTRTLQVAARIVREARRASVIYASGVFLESAWASRLSRTALVVKIPGDDAWDHAYNNRLTESDLASFDIGSVPRGKATVLRHAQRAACTTAQQVIVGSRFLADVVSSWGVPEDRLVVIPNAVEVPGHEPRYASRAAPDGRIRALSAGRMIRRKRFDELVDLAVAVPGLTLTLVGDGPERSQLAERVDALGVSGRVTMIPPVLPWEMGELYQQHDVLLMPALGETFSYVTIEAMAHGLPVVVADSGALPEVTGNGEWGVVCPVGDSAAWTSAVERLAAEPSWYRGVAERGWRAAHERYAWGPIYRQTLRVLTADAEVA